jgi:HEAT repeat protein
MDRMPTPTSQELPPNSIKLTPAKSFERLRRGEYQAKDLTGLSDLSKADLSEVKSRWGGLSESTRIAALTAMAKAANAQFDLDFQRMLLLALDDESATVRQHAISGLWEADSRSFIVRLLDIASTDPSQDVRAAATRELGRFAELAAADDLDDELASRLEQVLVENAFNVAIPNLIRRAALEGIAYHGNLSKISDLIEEFFASDDLPDQASALIAMGRTLDERWFERMIRAFESSDAEIRAAAAEATGLLGDPDAVTGLASLARDNDDEVRRAAIIALGQIGGTGATRALRQLKTIARESDQIAIDEALDGAQLESDPADFLG